MSIRSGEIPHPDIVAPSLEASYRAGNNSRRIEDHALPTCFVCGPARDPSDGLRISPGRVEPNTTDNPNPFPVALASWSPRPDLADENGLTAPEFIWAALDCPGAFALDAEPILLGRMTAEILDRPAPSTPVIIVAWATGEDGRKHYATTAMFNDQGRMLAHAQQTWIKIARHDHVDT
jgi:hypothetical protein